MTRLDGPGDPDVDRRTLLRGIGGGVLTGALASPGSTRTGWGDGDWTADLGFADGRDGIQEGPGVAGGSTTVTVAGEEHEVPIRSVRITGTCEDLAAFVEHDVLESDEPPVEFDPRAPPHAVDPDSFGGWDPSGEPEDEAVDPDGVNSGQDMPRFGRSVMDCEDPQSSGGQSSGHTMGYTNGQITIEGSPLEDFEWEEPEIGTLRIVGPAENEVESAYDGNGWIRDRAEVARTETDDGEVQLELTGIDVDFAANPVIVMPDWHPPHAISRECRREYCELIREIYEHERAHARIHLRAAADANRELADLEDRAEEVDDPLERSTDPADVENTAAVLYDTAREIVAETTEDIGCEKIRRNRQFHDEVHESVDVDFPALCESCTPCEEYEGGPLAAVDEWRLDVFYIWMATVSTPEEGLTHRIKQSYTGQFFLERAGESGGGTGSLIDGIASFLDGIESFLNDFLGIVGIELDLVPSTTRSGPQYYEGAGEVTAHHESQVFVDGEEGPVRTLVRASEFVTPDTTAGFELDPEAEEYLVQWPHVNPSGHRKTWSPNVAPQTEHADPLVQPGAIAMAQAQSDEPPDAAPDLPRTPADGNATGPGMPRGDIPDGSDFDWPTHQIEGCRRAFVDRFEQPLVSLGYPAAARGALSPNADGEPVGGEALTWRIVPLGDREEGHLDCIE